MALRGKSKLTARKLLAGGFSKDGAQVYGIVRNTTGEGAKWQLYTIDVKTAAKKMLAALGPARVHRRRRGIQYAS